MTLPQTLPEETLPAGCKAHTNCRVCGERLPKPYLDLGSQPLANGLHNPFAFTTAGPDEPKYPLAVTLCETCGLSQLTVVVDPRILYTHYRFASGVSSPWRNHTSDLAKECYELYGEDGFVIDIAANDGTQLQQFKNAPGRERLWKILGVEPSDIDTLLVGAHWEGVHAEIPILRAFWSQVVADNIKANDGPADVIIAQNVLGHVDDSVAFLKACKSVLKENGRIVVEVPNVGDLIDNMAFDTIYHEHLSYWSGLSMSTAALKAGLQVERVQKFPDIHGGTVRYWLEHWDGCHRIDGWRGSKKPYANFAERVANNINATAYILSRVGNKKFIAWGASAKGAVYMNTLYNRWKGVPRPEYILDQTPEKQGLLSPGLHIPIRAPKGGYCTEELSDIDVIWILSWNWLDRLKYEATSRGFKGKFLVTSPKPKLLS